MDKKNILLCVGAMFLGVITAFFPQLLRNEEPNAIVIISLYVSIITLVITNYISVENALKLRAYNKNKLFSDYCVRFSNDPYIKKVTEWLLTITELDSDGKIIRVNPKKSKDAKGNVIIEPTHYEKEKFLDFLIELNMQIKKKQIEKEYVKNVFSFYALVFSKVKHMDDKTIYYRRNDADFSELLLTNINDEI